MSVAANVGPGGALVYTHSASSYLLTFQAPMGLSAASWSSVGTSRWVWDGYNCGLWHLCPSRECSMALTSLFQHHHYRQGYSIENSEGFVCCKLVLSRDKFVQKIVMTGTVLAFGIETMQDNNRGKTLTLLNFCKFLANIAVLSFANTVAMMFGSINPSLLQSFIFRC